MRETVSGDLPALAECVDQFVPFLDYDIEICRVLCSTNAIESMNARYRPAVDAKGHFPPRAPR